ncbi:hypothetical protein M436DRAFT_50018 [Aureobasidium namibiae CBS 147.97]|uniref:Uncharacterized protein n=1 Tax=Aureobasidium namibiae CBS 147.97 TaxID=1043004 RepID=A0A074WER2_9PEZI|nr:uncharacterized protein M436DRAFT_50018 [Aureobasidium namibiae CBS 147.97]KEQ71570.1 hypothetical protein M436DRAFT_50018 [Aureobasidium namibiae CBS 147.97]
MSLWQSVAGVRRWATPAGSVYKSDCLTQTDESTDGGDENREGGAGKGRVAVGWYRP